MKIFEFSGKFSRPKFITLPDRDVLGWCHGKKYQSLLEARSVMNSTRSTHRGFKFKRRYESLSTNEFRIFLALDLMPYILDVREQYGIVDYEDYMRAEVNGLTMHRPDIMTIDAIATYLDPVDMVVKNHGISVKPVSYMKNRDIAREAREEAELAPLNWTWELVHGKCVSDTVHGNNLEIYKLVRDSDIEYLYDEARWFSEIFHRSSVKGTADSVLGRISKSLKINRNHAFRLFAVGCVLGFVRLNPLERFYPDCHLHVIR